MSSIIRSFIVENKIGNLIFGGTFFVFAIIISVNNIMVIIDPGIMGSGVNTLSAESMSIVFLILQAIFYPIGIIFLIMGIRKFKNK